MQDAEIHYGLTLSDTLAELVIDKRKATSRKYKPVVESATQPQHNNLATATPPPPPSSPPSTSNAKPLPTVENAFKQLTTLLDNDELEDLLNKLFLHLALAHNITSNPGNYCSMSIKAMELLKMNNKNNLGPVVQKPIKANLGLNLLNLGLNFNPRLLCVVQV